MPTVKFVGFQPDFNQSNLGTIIDVNNMVPTVNGMATFPSSVFAPGVPPVGDGNVVGAVIQQRLDGTTRFIAGTATKLKELVSGAWTDRTRSVGGNYTGGADTRWSFATFGDTLLAANGSDIIQSTTGGAFANVSGAPTTKILISVGDFVMALNTSSFADQWHCCAISNPSDWATSIATQSANGRLLETPGPIVAGKSLGSDVVAYKEKSIYIGRYVGPPQIWSWTKIPGEIGTFSNSSVISIGSAHFFVGKDDLDFYYFDGGIPRPLGAPTPVKEWFSANSDSQFRYKIFTSHDKDDGNVFFWFPSNGSGGGITTALVYNYRAGNGRWGKISKSTGFGGATVGIEYTTGPLSYDQLAAIYPTYADLPLVPYDSPFWLGGQAFNAIFVGDQLVIFSGPPEDCYLTTGDYGEHGAMTFLRRVRPELTRTSSPSPTVNTYYRNSLSDTRILVQQTPTPPLSLVNGSWDMLTIARWHSAKITFTSDSEIAGLDLDVVKASNE